MHADGYKDLPSNRNFGLTFAFAGLILASWLYLKASVFFGIVIASALTFLLVSFFCPNWFSFPNLMWFKFGLLLNEIVSPIALGILFFLVVTPVGWLMRRSRKDPLRLILDPNANTYWIDRHSTDQSLESLKRQF